MIFTDPILRKSHYHASKLKEPNVDEELELYYTEVDMQEEEKARQELAHLMQQEEEWFDE